MNALNRHNIRVHMPVIAACGKRIGEVDRVEGSSIKLTKSAPAAHGEHRFIPLAWVRSVAENVWLGREPRRRGFVDTARMQRDTQELLDGLGLGSSRERRSLRRNADRRKGNAACMRRR